MRTGFVVETIVKNCSCNHHPKHKLMNVDRDLFEAQTEDDDHFVDTEVGGRCKRCGEDMVIDIHFVVDRGIHNSIKILNSIIKEDEPLSEPDLNPLFWDCECEKDYIHMKANKEYCGLCDSFHWDQPDSRQNEVEQRLLEPTAQKSPPITELQRELGDLERNIRFLQPDKLRWTANRKAILDQLEHIKTLAREERDAPRIPNHER